MVFRMEPKTKASVGLMDIPVELRLLIYEYIPVERQDVFCPLRSDDASREVALSSTLTMLYLLTPFGILGVSRFIRKEASVVTMEKYHQIGLAVPRAAIERIMVHQLFQPCGIISLVTHWYQTLKQTDGNANLRICITEQSTCAPISMFGMPEPMLMFIRLAGYQMLSRTRLLESLHYSNGTATASVFFLVQGKDSTLPVLDVPNEEHPSSLWGLEMAQHKSAMRQCLPA